MLPNGNLIKSVRGEATGWVINAKDIGRITETPELQLMIKVDYIIDNDQKVGYRNDQLDDVNWSNVKGLDVQVGDVETIENDRCQQEKGIWVVQHKAGEEDKLLDAIVVIIVAKNAHPFVVDVFEVAPNWQCYQPHA